MWMAYHVGYDVTWHHVNGTKHNSMASRVISSKCSEMLKSRNHEIKRIHNTFQDCPMLFLPTTFRKITVLRMHILTSQQTISELPSASVSKQVPVQKFSKENEFDLHEKKFVGETHWHKNGFARKLVFTPRRRELRNGLLSKNWEKISNYAKKVEMWSQLRVNNRLSWQRWKSWSQLNTKVSARDECLKLSSS